MPDSAKYPIALIRIGIVSTRKKVLGISIISKNITRSLSIAIGVQAQNILTINLLTRSCQTCVFILVIAMK